MRIQVLALRDCTPIVPVAMTDLLRKSVELAHELGLAGRRRAPVEISMVAVGTRRTLRASRGMELRCETTTAEAPPGDLVIAAALDADLDEHVALNREAVAFLRRAWSRGADVASVCTGAFLLGEAGLLDGRAATTHWAFQSALAARFPRARLAPQAILVDTGRIVTCGGATSYLNLTLFLVERLFGVEVARAASKLFLIDVNKAPQGAYAMFSSQKTHGDAEIERAQLAIEEGIAKGDDGIAVATLARAVAMSTRTFTRRFRAATGNGPLEYIQRVRIEAARRDLEESARPVHEVAARVGYGDVVAFRRLFARITGLTPADYRARYGPRGAPSWLTSRASRR